MSKRKVQAKMGITSIKDLKTKHKLHASIALIIESVGMSLAPSSFFPCQEFLNVTVMRTCKTLSALHNTLKIYMF